jgi:hypothetical protein
MGGKAKKRLDYRARPIRFPARNRPETTVTRPNERPGARLREAVAQTRRTTKLYEGL